MRVAIIGATGLIGSLLADRLLAAGGLDVHALARRPSDRSHSRWHEEGGVRRHDNRAIRALAVSLQKARHIV